MNGVVTPAADPDPADDRPIRRAPSITHDVYDDEVLIHAEAGRITITKLDPDFDRLMAVADRFVAAHPNAIRKLAQ